ncbi:DUF3307 domain-containing protein [Flavobacterium agricola]|uniref:DUF3307 domain-containing protein n=1 Tax=Flavobacterium agricola TaxID=2870839 RepID=A0ABY6M011_9FLAO|nr:DUF3307 domain-containing protein [Flavobacterium agricola]UYW01893.1 DUF3307 domain-containing protein [Flavobacterium agricola]
MFELGLKITLVYLLACFVLVPASRFKKQASAGNLVSKFCSSTVVVWALLLLVTQFKKNYVFPNFLLAFVFACLACFTQLVLRGRIKNIWVFALSVSLHVLCMACFVYYFYPFQLDFSVVFSTKVYLLLVALLLLTLFCNVLIKRLMEFLNYAIPKTGITDGGKYIGMLERLFVFLFVVMNFWEGIGFLLAAKSIFRFGDLKENKDVKLTEYILIGTLLSFGLAILLGKLYLYFSV